MLTSKFFQASVIAVLLSIDLESYPNAWPMLGQLDSIECLDDNFYLWSNLVFESFLDRAQ